MPARQQAMQDEFSMTGCRNQESGSSFILPSSSSCGPVESFQVLEDLRCVGDDDGHQAIGMNLSVGRGDQ